MIPHFRSSSRRTAAASSRRRTRVGGATCRRSETSPSSTPRARADASSCTRGEVPGRLRTSLECPRWSSAPSPGCMSHDAACTRWAEAWVARRRCSSSRRTRICLREPSRSTRPRTWRPGMRCSRSAVTVSGCSSWRGSSSAGSRASRATRGRTGARSTTRASSHSPAFPSSCGGARATASSSTRHRSRACSSGRSSGSIHARRSYRWSAPGSTPPRCDRSAGCRLHSRASGCCG